MKAAVFPGQGVHGPGMSGDLAEARPDVFEEASKALGQDVAELCREGRSGEADLSSTRWAQPAIVACSVASALVMMSEGLEVEAVAGHSLGEYSALVVAGSLSVADGVRLVTLRAELMNTAAGAAPGGMAAVLALDADVVGALCKEHGTVISGDNAPGQLTISGPEDALEATMAAAKERKGKVRRINVSGAFHSPAMAPAMGELRAALEQADVRAPQVPVWSPTTGEQVREPAEIRDALVEQLVKPVLWRQAVQSMIAAGTTSFVDVGPDKVVGNLIRRISPDVTVSIRG